MYMMASYGNVALLSGLGIAGALCARQRRSASSSPSSSCCCCNAGSGAAEQAAAAAAEQAEQAAAAARLACFLNEKCRFGMRLLRADRERLEAELALSTPALLRLCVGVVEKWSRCAISGFQVGVAGLASASGDVYFGVNLEFDAVPLSCTVHAEQFLVTNLFFGRARGLDMLALKYPPCGHCRQFLAETVGTDVVIRLSRGEDLQVEARLSELLPSAFTPKDLGVQVGLLDDRQSNVTRMPLRERRDSLKWASSGGGGTGGTGGTGAGSRGTGGSGGGTGAGSRGTGGSAEGAAAPVSDNDMRRLALDAAGRAFAPFTGVCEGVALLTKRNEIVVGSTIESAAYNPSLTAIQTALIDTVRRDIPFSDILRATMVALQGPSKSAVADAFTGRKAHPESVGYGRELLATVTGLRENKIRGFMVDNWQPPSP
jgi:cytidine deaminase